MPPTSPPPRTVGGWRARLLRLGATGDRAALGFVLLVALAAFAPAWARGEVFHESDTITYYGPFAEYAAGTLSEGALPLWNPFVYMGYPQFADGETGVLFPLHFLALATGQVDTLLLWGPVVRALLAAFAAYWLARTLRVSPAGAALAGLAFGLGSFSVAQQHHLNVANSIFVLPGMLATVERAAIARTVRARLGWFLGGGLLFALALVGVHPQIVMIVGLGVLLHVALSLVAGRWRVSLPRPSRRILWLLGGGIAMALVGSGLAALQVVPLYQLITDSLRGVTISDVEASRFALLSWASAQLLFPQVLGAGDSFWGPWNRWETSLYLGALPFCLAVLALVHGRTRVMWVLAAGTLVAWLLAAGLHGPTDIYDLLRSVPGFDRARAPGRFVLIVVLNLALLAGFGLDALRDRRLSWRWPAILTLLPLLGWVGLWAINRWIGRDPGTRFEVAAWADGLPGSSSVDAALPADDLVLAATDPGLTANWLPVAAALLALAIITAFLRSARFRSLIVPVLLLCAAVELSFFAATFHPRIAVTDVLDPPAHVAAATVSGPYPRTVLLGEILDGSNYLLGSRIAEASGYASLVPRRQAALLDAWYAAPARFSRLLGAARVFYSTDPTRGFEARFAEAFGVRYSILRPAVVLDPDSPSGDGLIDLANHNAPARMLAILSLEGATDIPGGITVATVGWLRSGELLGARELKAGEDVSERTGFGALAFRTPAHSEAPGPSVVVGNNRDSLYHLVAIDIPPDPEPDHLVLRAVHPDVRLGIHGLTLVDTAGRSAAAWIPQLRPAAGERELLVGQFDPGERVALFIRADLATDPEDALAILQRRDPGYPSRPVIEAGDFAPGLPASLLAGTPGTPGTATLIEDSPLRLTIATESPEAGILVVRDAYDDGWKAYVDGVETAVLPADLASRAVSVPAGRHEVVLEYDPPAVRLGAMISAATLVLVLIAGLILWRGPALARRLRGRY
ncbi:MAG: YfhO family protein [Chloroflexota bacterium]|jgi:hypothetical protein|nr:YfhO family protein [Chloroflexota bacterium]MDP6758437.1 YfhO family protein [Chloroflexota bacterium]